MIKTKYIFLLALLFISELLAQPPGRMKSRYGFEVNAIPPAYYTASLRFDKETQQPLLEVVLKAQYDLLQFIRTDEGYSSAYELSLVIRKKANEETVLQDVWKEELRVSDFETTNARDLYHKSVREIPLSIEPGEYTLLVIFTDKESGRTLTGPRDFTLAKYSTEELVIGDPILTDLSGEISEVDRKDMLRAIPFARKSQLLFDVRTPFAQHVPVKITMQLQQEGKAETVFDDSLSFPAGVSSHQFLLDTEKLEEGTYSVQVKIDAAGTPVSVIKRFEVVWFDKPVYLYRSDLARRPMLYILSTAEKQQLEDLSSDEQAKWIERWWKEKDPTPETAMNELKAEFFSRVSDVNKRYSNRFEEGWETDRGKTEILYGKPDRVEKNPYAANNHPYEVWYYEPRNEKITFIDFEGNQDYRLVSVEKIDEKEN
jgi:GWxTD domain-containing protein